MFDNLAFFVDESGVTLPNKIRPRNDGTGVNDAGHAGPYTISPDAYASNFTWTEFELRFGRPNFYDYLIESV